MGSLSEEVRTEVLCGHICDLEAENERLRELVKAMEPFLCCMPFASCNTLAANVRKRMRELGIEVDA